MARKILQGTIIRNSLPKTIVVEVTRRIAHPKYKKYIRSSKRYHAHYEEGEYKAGDVVAIEESRPISKIKRWRVAGLITKTGTLDGDNTQT